MEKENVVEVQARGAAWKPAQLGLELAIGDRLRTGEFSRAAVRFTDLSMLRVDELTTIEISPPIAAGGKRSLDVKRGGTYFFSRDKAQEIEIRTPVANGALRGTEFELRVADNGRTRLTMFDGEVELHNAHGSVRIGSGEQAVVEPGRAPRKTAVIEAVNVIQWCLYYPAVIDPDELRFPSGEPRALDSALSAYRAGDLLGALESHAIKRGGGSTDERLFRAAVILASGQVDKARAALAGVSTSDSRRQALEQMIAAVKFQPWPRAAEPRTSSEWMAESYYQQSRSNLEAALKAARKATELSPNFGYAWARVAELEFSFGRTMKSMKVLEHALELSPRNAQAHSLQGFLLAAENRIGAARRSFDAAIALDGALGNAWLGRGLTFIRQNQEVEGRHDLQTAAVLEPNRSILRSYLGKAFSQVGLNAKANLELDRAKQLDPHDPTPWLYSAIQRKQENRYNEAIDDLEKSVELNDNRRVYRSQFLLDQDRAIRGANLAAIYEKDGLIEQSVREAVRAVNDGYSSAPAHLFLANSYNALRDPARVQLRYETAWSNEQLLANLLSPVGGGPLSQFVSEQEYSKLFERDGLGINSVTWYSSDGQFRETGSQYGTWGNVSYALDSEYQFNSGVRPNNDLSRFESYASFKFQLGPQDTAFFQTKFGTLGTGDVFQRYDPREATNLTFKVLNSDGSTQNIYVPNTKALTSRFDEKQDPGVLLLGWHHEWSPGQHTLLLLGRLANRQVLTDRQTDVATVIRDVTLDAPRTLDPFVGSGAAPTDPALFAQLTALKGRGQLNNYLINFFDLDYRASFETYSAELQHIITAGPETVVLGGRHQSGQFETRVALSNYNNGAHAGDVPYFGTFPIFQDSTVDFERINLYAYNTLKLTRWLSLTGGVTYDHLKYPDNFRSPPVNNQEAILEKTSPKAGMIIEPWRGAVIRGAFTEAINGASFDESVRLEPTQVAGFLQAYRGLAPESLVGSTAGSKYQLVGASFEQKLSTRTYFGIEANELRQNLDRTIGVFDQLAEFGYAVGIVPSSLAQRGHYHEDSLTATLNQLIGNRWSVGLQYRYIHSELEQEFPRVNGAFDRTLDTPTLENITRTKMRQAANLHQLNIFGLYNHPSGFFARAEANWYRQDNDNYVTSTFPTDPAADPFLPNPVRTRNIGLPGDDFWQFNLFAGYRFYRNQCEVSVGGMNLTDRDYRLNPLNPYVELPRQRTFVVRCKLNF